MSRRKYKCDEQRLACICDILECTDVTFQKLQGLLPRTYVIDDIDILVQIHPDDYEYVIVTQQAMARFGRWMLQELGAKNATIAELQKALVSASQGNKELSKSTIQNLTLTVDEQAAKILELQRQLKEQQAAKPIKESWLDKLKNLFK